MRTTPDRQSKMVATVAQSVDSAEPWLKVIGSRHLVDWLATEQVSLAFTTYKLGKLLFLGQKSHHELAVFER